LIGPAPLKTAERLAAEAKLTGSYGAFARVNNANNGSAARDDEKLSRAGLSNSGRFRAWANRSCRERQRLLLRINTVRVTLADPIKKVGAAKRKTPKGGQKEPHSGKATMAGQAA